MIRDSRCLVNTCCDPWGVSHASQQVFTRHLLSRIILQYAAVFQPRILPPCPAASNIIPNSPHRIYNAFFGKIGRHDFLRIKYHSNPRRRAGGFLFPVFGRSRELSTGKAKENSKGKDRNARQPQVVYRRRIVVCETKEREGKRGKVPLQPPKGEKGRERNKPGFKFEPS